MHYCLLHHHYDRHCHFFIMIELISIRWMKIKYVELKKLWYPTVHSESTGYTENKI